MIIKAKYLAIPLLVICNSVFAADVNCDYSDKTVVKTTGKIDGILGRLTIAAIKAAEI